MTIGDLEAVLEDVSLERKRFSDSPEGVYGERTAETAGLKVKSKAFGSSPPIDDATEGTTDFLEDRDPTFEGK